MSRHKPSALAQLRELRSYLTLDAKRFVPSTRPAFSEETVTFKNDEELRAFIAERTRLWRQSWVLPIVDALIAREERKKTKLEARKVKRR